MPGKFLATLGALVFTATANADFTDVYIEPSNPVVGKDVFLVVEATFPDILTNSAIERDGNTIEVFLGGGVRVTPIPDLIIQRLNLSDFIGEAGTYSVNVTIDGISERITPPPFAVVVSPVTVRSVPAMGSVASAILIGVCALFGMLLLRKGTIFGIICDLTFLSIVPAPDAFAQQDDNQNPHSRKEASS